MTILLTSAILLSALSCATAFVARRGGLSGVGDERHLADVLLTAVAERDPHLGAHACDVAEAVAIAAQRLGLRGARVRQVRLAAELHDVGKLAIPERILNKPGPLDDDEWRVMQTHAEIGGRILGCVRALAPVAALVRAHHERHDGTGYPLGLSGERIPLGARIIAVCDAYDAMTTQRVYNRPVAPAVALQRLRESAGTQFDPTVVEVVCETLEELLEAQTVRPAQHLPAESHAVSLQRVPPGTIFA
jgi:HD-GYP domain-containing protein (c-di-GMP phosphodiesterase class II)